MNDQDIPGHEVRENYRQQGRDEAQAEYVNKLANNTRKQTRNGRILETHHLIQTLTNHLNNLDPRNHVLAPGIKAAIGLLIQRNHELKQITNYKTYDPDIEAEITTSVYCDLSCIDLCDGHEAPIAGKRCHYCEWKPCQCNQAEQNATETERLYDGDVA